MYIMKDLNVLAVKEMDVQGLKEIHGGKMFFYNWLKMSDWAFFNPDEMMWA